MGGLTPLQTMQYKQLFILKIFQISMDMAKN